MSLLMVANLMMINFLDESLIDDIDKILIYCMVFFLCGSFVENLYRCLYIRILDVKLFDEMKIK